MGLVTMSLRLLGTVGFQKDEELDVGVALKGSIPCQVLRMSAGANAASRWVLRPVHRHVLCYFRPGRLSPGVPLQRMVG